MTGDPDPGPDPDLLGGGLVQRRVVFVGASVATLAVRVELRVGDGRVMLGTQGLGFKGG